MNESGEALLGLVTTRGSDFRIRRQQPPTAHVVPVARGRGLLCLNVDRTPLDDAVRILSAFAAPVTPPPAVLFDQDWRGEVDAIVGTWCRRAGRTAGALSPADRYEVLRELERAGVFAIRHAAGHVTRVLGVSRATLYGQLKRVRAEIAAPAGGDQE